MNLRTIVAAALISIPTMVYAQSPEQVLEQANRLYQENKFAEAKDAYESLVRNGYVSGDLYYNLGNAYYKLGNFARAILNFERACRFMPNDEDLNHNLQVANLMITDKVEPTPRLFIWDYWDAAKNAFSMDSITWVMYTWYVIVVALIGAAILWRPYRTRRWGMVAIAVSGVACILSIVLFVAKLSDLNRNDMAVVTTNVTTIKNSPDARSSDAFVLHAGVKVQITDKVSDWVKIRLADGKVGWMEMTAAEVI
jgi:tetratricopeptide (TPR) repeat protein